MILYDRVRRRQAEPGPFRFSRKIGIKNALQVFFRNADAFVANLDANIVAGSQIRNERHRNRVVPEIVATDPECSAVRHGLIGIDYQVADYLTDLAGMD